MSKIVETKNVAWINPKLVKLGKIADVAGPPAGALQSTTKS